MTKQQALEKENKSLINALIAKEEKIHKSKAEIDRLNELVKYYQQMLFGKSSEKSKGKHTSNFNEAEESVGDDDNITVDGHTRKRGKRKPLPVELEREDVIVDLPEDQKFSKDGTPLVEIGEEVSEKLDIIPSKIRVIRTVRKKYGLPNGEGSIKTAALPPSILPKSLATAGLLAYIIVSKYMDALPLYRLEKIFQRIGIDLTRTTMSRWLIRVSLALQPIKNLMSEDLLSGSYIGMDETRTQVLNEKGKTAESNSYMWVRGRAGPSPIVLFDYNPSRSGDVAKDLLTDFKGVLQVDGYSGYNQVCKLIDVVRAGCWAHCRRYFKDAAKNSKKKKKADRAIKLIDKLYKIEDECEELTPDKKREYRQEHAVKTMDKLNSFLKENFGKVPPKSLIGKALLYMKNEWGNLQVYLTDGNIRIDNNFIENKIRPFALGRKNWLFSTSVDGAEASATLYSMIETAKANNLNPYDYLRYVLEELPKRETLEEIEELLPYNVKLPSKS